MAKLQSITFNHSMPPAATGNMLPPDINPGLIKLHVPIEFSGRYDEDPFRGRFDLAGKIKYL